MSPPHAYEAASNVANGNTPQSILVATPPDLGGLLESLLSFHNFNVVRTHEPAGAVSAVMDQHFDLAIVDLDLCVGEGDSLLDWLHQAGLAMVYVSVTPPEELPPPLASRLQLACACLPKPIHTRNLLDTVNALLRPPAPAVDEVTRAQPPPLPTDGAMSAEALVGDLVVPVSYVGSEPAHPELDLLLVPAPGTGPGDPPREEVGDDDVLPDMELPGSPDSGASGFTRQVMDPILSLDAESLPPLTAVGLDGDVVPASSVHPSQLETVIPRSALPTSGSARRPPPLPQEFTGAELADRPDYEPTLELPEPPGAEEAAQPPLEDGTAESEPMLADTWEALTGNRRPPTLPAADAVIEEQPYIPEDPHPAETPSPPKPPPLPPDAWPPVVEEAPALALGETAPPEDGYAYNEQAVSPSAEQPPADGQLIPQGEAPPQFAEGEGPQWHSGVTVPGAPPPEMAEGEYPPGNVAESEEGTFSEEAAAAPAMDPSLPPPVPETTAAPETSDELPAQEAEPPPPATELPPQPPAQESVAEASIPAEAPSLPPLAAPVTARAATVHPDPSDMMSAWLRQWPQDSAVDGSRIQVPLPPESGSLSTVPLKDVLDAFHTNGLTGAVTVQRGQLIYKLAIQHGWLLSAQGNATNELVRAVREVGVLDEAAVKSAMDAVGGKATRLLQYLLEQSAITQDQAARVLLHYRLRTCCQAFAVTDGTYQYALCPAPVSKLPPLYMGQVIIRSLLATTSLETLRARIQREHRFAPASAGRYSVERLSLQPAELALLHNCDGTKTVGDLLDLADLSEQHTLGLLDALHGLRLLEQLSSVPASKRKVVFF